MKFMTYYEFNRFAVQCYFAFFFPGFTIAHVSQTEYEEIQQKVILLENNASCLSSELSNAN
jgi:hypothetical protein